MSNIALESVRMMDMLPDADQMLIYELIKKMVLAWDPDFTKVTTDEAKEIAEAENSGYVDEEDIDWSTIGIDSCE